MKVIVEADGGSRGNPGPAGYGSVVWTADRTTVLAESKQAIGRATNNVAEYRALITAMEEAKKLGAKRIKIRGDSELVVRQMTGIYRVKHPDLIPLHRQAKELLATFDEATIEHNSAKDLIGQIERANRFIACEGVGKRFGK